MITQHTIPQHPSISDIVDGLKTAFRQSDYIDAVKVLTSREDQLTQIISNLTTQNKALLAELEAKDAQLGVLETELSLRDEAVAKEVGRCEWLVAYSRLLENQEEALRTKYEEELGRLRRREEELRRPHQGLATEEAINGSNMDALERKNQGLMVEKPECQGCAKRLKGEIDDDGVKTHVQFLCERKVEVEAKMAELEREKVKLEASLEEMRAVEVEKEGKIMELMKKVEELERKNKVIQIVKEKDEGNSELEKGREVFKCENSNMLGRMNQAIDIARLNNTKILELRDEKRVLEAENSKVLARLKKIESFLKLDGDAIASRFGVVEKDAKFSCSEIEKLLAGILSELFPEESSVDMGYEGVEKGGNANEAAQAGIKNL